MRLFIAINFEKETKNKLLSLRDELRAVSSSGNFSLPENIHLTLVFLGECDHKQTAAVKKAMDMVFFEPFDMRIERLGRFRRDDGDLWWVGVQESKPLLDLQRNLTDLLGQHVKGIAIDKRKYSPHITLGRKVEADVNPRQIEPFGETVGQVDLMKSERINGKLTYTAIYTI